MTQIMSKRSKEKTTRSSSSASSWNNKMASVLLGIAGIILALFLYSANGNHAQETTRGSAVVEEVGSKRASSSGSTEKIIISSGSVNSIPFYHCGTENNINENKHLVLLHGAKFTKEDWKTSGILKSLCKAKGLSVSAMDLPVSAGHQELKTLLASMQTEGMLNTPVTLVTPSASGKTITDWMTNGDLTELPSYISKWIPVAAGSVSSPSDEQVGSLKGKLSILAIYGSRDAMGKRVTERLAELASAETLEVEGGHPCYLDSPDDFVSAIFRSMDVST